MQSLPVSSRRHRPAPFTVALLAMVMLVASIVSARAQLTWNTAGPTNNWSALPADTNWSPGGVTWTNGSSAIFSGTGETVELEGALTVADITFNSTGFVIADANNNASLSLSGPSNITVTTANQTATISDALATGAIQKAGAGTLILSGANSYAGATTVSAGILQVSNNTALGSTAGATSVVSGAGLILADGITVSGEAISIAGSSSNSAGALQAGTNANATWTGAVTLADAAARVGTQSGGVLTLSGVIQDGTNNSLFVSAFGTGSSQGVVLISGSAKTYSGTTNIIRGILKLGGTDLLPTATTLNVDQSTATEDSIFDLNGFDQTVRNIQHSNTAGTGGSFITNNGSSLSTLTVSPTTSASYDGILKDGTGVLALTKTGAGTLTLSGANSYSGDTTVSAGTLALGNVNILQNSTLNTSTAGSQLVTFTVAGTNTYNLGGLKGADALVINGNTINVGANGQSTIFTGGISGTGGALTKIGAGTLELAGANSYTGATVVSGGTLIVSGSISGTVSAGVASGTLLLGQSNAINHAATVTLDGGVFGTGGFSQGDATTNGLGALSLLVYTTLDFGAGSGSQLWFAGVGTHAAGSTLSILNWNGTASHAGGAGDDRLIFAGADSSAFTGIYNQADVSFNGVSGYAAIQFDANHFEIVAIPEPSSSALLGVLGLLGFIGFRGRRRSA